MLDYLKFFELGQKVIITNGFQKNFLFNFNPDFFDTNVSIPDKEKNKRLRYILRPTHRLQLIVLT